MRLILVRHGETEENRKGIIQGQMQGKLTEKGLKQAKRLANRLKARKIDVIYSSDLARARDTAEEIAKLMPNVPFHLEKGLRERKLGELRGKTKEELGMSDRKFVIVFLNPKNGETRKDMYQRAQSFLKRIYKKHKKGTVLVVGHNGINKALAAAVLEKGPSAIRELPNQKNTAITSFEIRGGRAERVKRNCTEHLE